MNKYNPQIHHRRSIRLKGYDYTRLGVYFVTICTYRREHLFGEVVDGKMVLNPFGRVAPVTVSYIDGKGEATPRTSLPAQMRGDAETSGPAEPGGGCLAPTVTMATSNGAPPGSMGAIVGNVKSTITRRINQMRRTPGAKVWQRNYWEHVVRTPEDHARIEDYICLNPVRWRADDLHPDAPPNPFNQERE